MPEISPEWTSPGYIASLWHVLLIGGGVIGFIYILAQRERWAGLPPPEVRAWRIGWLDMGLLFCLLFMWSLAAGSITGRLLPLGEDPAHSLLAWRTALDGMVLQAGMILVFFGFWLSQPYEHRLPFSSEPMPGSAALGKALLYFLAFMPARYLLELAWMATLTQLDKLGLPLPMEPQLVTGFFNRNSPPLAFVSLVLLAVIVAPIVEELVFRAGLYRFLKARLGTHGAMIASAGVFALLHGNLLSAPTLMLLGIALCLAYESGGNIKVPIIMHAVFNMNSVLLIVLQTA